MKMSTIVLNNEGRRLVVRNKFLLPPNAVSSLEDEVLNQRDKVEESPSASRVKPDNIVLKLMPGAIIFLIWGVNFNNNAIASTLKVQENNSYDLEKLSYFSLKLNQDIYNQLEKDILKQEFDFSGYTNLIDSGLNKHKYPLQSEPNILIQTENDGEEQLLGSFLDSVRKLEFQGFSDNSSYQASIPVLPQVNYRNVYKDIYDFDVNLTNSSQQRDLTRGVQKTSIRTQRSPENKYFSSYFQGNSNPNYSSFKSQPSNSNSNINNTNSPLLPSPQKRATLASLINLSLVDLSTTNNKSEFSFLQNSIADINQSTYNNNYEYSNDDDSQLDNEVQAVYLPSTEMEIYQFSNFDVPSTLSTYQKPEHQEELDKIIQKEKEKAQKQRQEMYKKLAKLRTERKRAREKELKQYQKKRQQALIRAMKQQQKLQQQRQRQFRY